MSLLLFTLTNVHTRYEAVLQTYIYRQLSSPLLYAGNHGDRKYLDPGTRNYPSLLARWGKTKPYFRLAGGVTILKFTRATTFFYSWPKNQMARNLMLLSLSPEQVVSVAQEEEEDWEWLRGHNCTTEVDVTKFWRKSKTAQQRWMSQRYFWRKSNTFVSWLVTNVDLSQILDIS